MGYLILIIIIWVVLFLIFYDKSDKSDGEDIACTVVFSGLYSCLITLILAISFSSISCYDYVEKTEKISYKMIVQTKNGNYKIFDNQMNDIYYNEVILINDKDTYIEKSYKTQKGLKDEFIIDKEHVILYLNLNTTQVTQCIQKE